MRRSVLIAGWVLVATTRFFVASEPVSTIVFCAPGYPGSTEQAQETMDDLAAAVARGAGLSEGDLRAVYHETSEGGLDLLASPGATVAVVTLPFYLRYGAELGLRPHLAGVQDGSIDQVWTLVAPAGRVSGPEDLAGWEVTGVPGYAPGFVRGPALGDWGALPDSAKITFTSRPLSALRRASRGEEVAVLLDRAQTEALGSLPFADLLEIVARSEPVPGSVVCSVGDRMPERAARVVEVLESLPTLDGGPEILETIRLDGFRTVGEDRMTEVESAYADEAEPRGEEKR
jgi:hypothetical protein